MIRRRIALALPALLLARPAAASLQFNTAPAQGTLLFGRTTPGTRIALGGRAVMVAADGAFAFGLGRDAAAQATLTITPPRGIAETQLLSVARRQWQIQRLEGLPDAMVTPPPEVLERIRRDRERIAAARRHAAGIAHFIGGFAWPAQGRISGVYGSQRILNGQPRAPHLGLDIAVPVGTPLAAMAAGRVLLAEDLYFTGNTVILDHGLGVQSLYAHMSRLDVSEGAEVAKAQRIGLSGATGRVTGPHLHLGLNWHEVAVDPHPVLPAQAR